MARKAEPAPVLYLETSAVLLRLRATSVATEPQLADAARSLDDLWARCEVWELTPAVCEPASRIVPEQILRTLAALHIATWLLARRRLGAVDLLTADRRIAKAAGVAIM